MAGDWFKMIADVADALGVGNEAKEALGGWSAYAEGRATQTETGGPDGPVVYERWLTRPRDPRVNDR